ncbi:MAG TPA: hypothetical protein VKX28_04975 [Xanthobacteraceae bacterium]|nr:hypothetical protein [Xanthobacteraceae bacterium]
MNEWFDIARDAGRLAIEAHGVVGLRLARLARGGKRGRAESRRMVTEKAQALVEANVAAARALLSGDGASAIAHETIGIYRRRVRGNRRRLTPRWWCWW